MHQIPVPGITGPGLWLTALAAVGPDPAGALRHAGASTMVCFQSEADVAQWHPGYLAWLRSPAPHEAWHHPTPDLGVLPDAELTAIAAAALGRLHAGEGILAHCGAGLGRAGQLACAVLLLTEPDRPLDEVLATVRAARPGAGPQSRSQLDQLRRLAVADVNAEARPHSRPPG
jgi:protein-tyrosine phosphatase